MYNQTGEINLINKPGYYYDSNLHIICFPYNEEKLHKMANDLNIGHSFFRNTHYKIPRSVLEIVETECILVENISELIQTFKSL